MAFALSAPIPSRTVTALSLTATQFASFATPAITVAFPSAYAQTQIPFVFSAVPTWAATRIPTTIGGFAATAGISSALPAQGTMYGETGPSSGGGGGWPVWATGVIAGCGGAAVILLGLGIWCFCRARKRRPTGTRWSQGPVLTEKYAGGGAARSSSAKDSKLQREHAKQARSSFFGVSGAPPPPASDRYSRQDDFYSRQDSSSDRSSRRSDPYLPPHTPQRGSAASIPGFRPSNDRVNSSRSHISSQTPSSDLSGPSYHEDPSFGSPDRLLQPHAPETPPRSTRYGNDAHGYAVSSPPWDPSLQGTTRGGHGRTPSEPYESYGRQRNYSVPSTVKPMHKLVPPRPSGRRSRSAARVPTGGLWVESQDTSRPRSEGRREERRDGSWVREEL